MPESAGTRAEILRVALELFRAQGYDATSLRQIAERLGITKAALYYHFKAKEQLVVELTRPFLDGFADIVASARSRDREATDASVEELLGQYLDLIIAEHAALSLLASDPAALNHPDVGLRGGTLVRAFQAELVGREASDADHIRAACALGAVNATAGLPEGQVASGRDDALRAALAALRSGTE
ncbi:MAG TPA: helix-turn-helix domain-containing protein [Frankiaceae bacterium]|nr:helix-turn-helix domain-containing protein [Frankiaceae bacterium]